MTLIIALKGKITDESEVVGAVVASDTQVTSHTKDSMLKIFQLGELPILVGGSGSASLSRHLISELEQSSQSYQRMLGRKMTCYDFDNFVNLKVEPFLREKFSSHADVVENSGQQLILSFSDVSDVRLYVVQSDGVPMRVDHDPGYCCIGIGNTTGGMLLINQFFNPRSNLINLTKLASYIIYQVSKVTPSVGGSIQTKLNFGGKIINPKMDFDLEYAQLRSDTMKKVWALLDKENVPFEREFNKALGKKEFRSLVRKMQEA